MSAVAGLAIGHATFRRRHVPPPKRRLLLIGTSAQARTLGSALGDAYYPIEALCRPTIALVSSPLAPATPLNFEDLRTRHVAEDCRKAHLTALKSTAFDVLVLDIAGDFQRPLLRRGSSFISDPNRMQNVFPDSTEPLDVASLLGVGLETFDSFHSDFFRVWSQHFDNFYAEVLKPRIADGCTVICPQATCAEKPVDQMLQRMYSHVATYPDIRRIGNGTASDARNQATVDKPDIALIMGALAGEPVVSPAQGRTVPSSKIGALPLFWIRSKIRTNS